ncbi:hypothetical protein LENED_008809 [Lentinula edodes]|uniref:CxC1-like cysteine cluster associated with KDZ transposases domain-containing protein n=1 Tax=Lentinula edodes TaxID=5353 RepID=A0A1Q3EI05_LENED|nr:hypothetical protein LENED_008809 [Lentinula edodes]
MCGLQSVLAVFHLFSLKLNDWELLLLLKSESKQLSEALKQAKEFQKALDDLAGKAHPGIKRPQAMDVDESSFDMSMAANEDDDEDVGEGWTGDLVGMTIDIRDVLHFRRWEGHRKYKNARTWKNQVDNFNNAWASLIDEMTEASIKWKYNLDSPDNFNKEYSFKIDAVNVYTLEKEVCIHRSKNTKAAVALVSAGYLGTSPEFPSLAISLQTLELYYTLCLFKQSFSIKAFAKALCHLYLLPFRWGYRTGLSDTFDIYLAIQQKIDTQVAKELGHEGANHCVLNSCPACYYKLEDKPELECSRMWVVNGNNSLKRMAGIGNREVSDTWIFGESDYYLSEDFVNINAGEIKACPLARNIEDEDPDELQSDWIDEEHGDPTDGIEDMGSSIVAKALEVLPPRWLMGYNIGCSFGGTILRSSLGLEFAKQKCRTCVNAFHGYLHNAACQQKYHPLNILGMGLENLKTLEQLFSLSNQLAPLI